jgi:hypothetical protein
MADQLVIFEMSTMGELLNGGIGNVLNKLMGQVVGDIKARMTDKKARKITIGLSFVPDVEAHYDEITKQTSHELRGIKVVFEYDIKVPKRTSLQIDCGVDANGRLLVNPNSPLNHAQQTFVDDADDANTIIIPPVRKVASAGR